MPIEEVKRARLICTRCGYTWFQRGDKLPKTCANPKCKSPYWNVERKKKED